MKKVYGVLIIIVLAAFAYSSISQTALIREKVDDWEYKPGGGARGIVSQLGGGALPPATRLPSFTSKLSASTAPLQIADSASESLGFSVGGAKDVNNFRENIKNNYLPLPTDITYEGLFYDYYFDTGKTGKCPKLFCPSYSYAISRDPFSGEEEYYLAVGMNSGMKESDFKRKKLNLVIVLDTSGSMGSPFNSYYYDQFGNKQIIGETEDIGKSKMEIAAKSVVLLLDHLEDDDKFGMVLFNDLAHLAKPLSLVGGTDMREIEGHILELSSGGGTKMSAGMQMATGLFEEFADVDQSEYENRIIFLTDAMPNRGEISEQGLLGMVKENADSRIYTTFIGVGVDFNTELVEYITKIRGANYYAVHSAEQFKDRMDEGFDYMVTPLVFDLQLNLDAQGYEIENVYGSPEANEATGEIMKVNTLFPSRTAEGETRGGLVLLKLRKTSPETSLKLKVSYEDRTGSVGEDEAYIDLETGEPDVFENKGTRKGVLLSRYADLMKNWIIDERSYEKWGRSITPHIDSESGIAAPEPTRPSLGRWERKSSPLRVSGEYRDLFREFRAHFESEMDFIDDDALNQELVILQKLENYD